MRRCEAKLMQSILKKITFEKDVILARPWQSRNRGGEYVKEQTADALAIRGREKKVQTKALHHDLRATIS